MNLTDFIIYNIIAIVTFIILFSTYNPLQNGYVYMSFMINGLFYLDGIIRTQRAITIKRTIYIFCYIFFFIAPWQQYSDNTILWAGNGLSIVYTDEMYLKANVLVLIALICIEFGYSFSNHHEKQKQQVIKKEKENVVLRKNNLLIISTFSLLFLIISHNINDYNPIFGISTVDSQIIHMIKFFPVISLLIYGMIENNLNKNLKDRKFLYLLVIFLVIYFPFWGETARFLLLGSYMMLLCEWNSNSKYKSLYFLIYFIGFVLLFSSLRAATSLDIIRNFKMEFNHVDYDAYQLMMAIIEYTDQVGFVWGKNIISAFAFLIPRGIWKGKMPPTGELFMPYFGCWFTNASSPLFAEFYLALGWIGVIVFSVLLGIVIHKIDGWENENSIIKRVPYCVIVGITMYILRGALLPAMSFTLGLLLAVVCINAFMKVKII